MSASAKKAKNEPQNDVRAARVHALLAKARRMPGRKISVSADMLAAVADAMEDAADLAVYRARAGQPTIPHDVAMAILEETHPVRAWRKHKGMTIQQLATAADHMQAGYLSEIETGKKPGSIAAYKALAKALGIGVDLLLID